MPFFSRLRAHEGAAERPFAPGQPRLAPTTHETPHAPRARRLVALATAALALGAACGRTGTPAPKRYVLRGQVLAVTPARQSLSIKHEDIVGYMPAMTMTFQVARPDLLTGREPGELITGTLEVDDASARIVEITRTGMAALPSGSNTAALAAGLLAEGDAAPDAALIDSRDRRRAFSDWKGAPTLLTFIYTRCPLPNFCPLMDKHFATIQRAILADPALAPVQLVSVTFDPDHDTPAVLAAHARKVGADPARWTFLTGDRVTIDRFAAKFGVSVLREDAELTHNLRTILIGADGTIRKIYGGSDWTPAAVIDDLRAAARHTP